MFRRKLISQHSKLSLMNLEHQKRGRPVGSKDKNPRKRKINDNKKDLVEDVNIHEETLDMTIIQLVKKLKYLKIIMKFQ